MRHARPAVVRNLVLPAVAAGSVSFLAAVGIAAAAGAPTVAPAPAPSAVVMTTQGPARLAPRCFETSVGGAQDCAWVPVAPCESDESGDEAIPPSYEGCYWDAPNRGNHEGASYVYWRLNRG